MAESVEITASGTVIQTIKRTYKPTWICYPFFKFDDSWRHIRTQVYGRLRKRDRSCFFCGQGFADDENMGLVSLKGRTNELACQCCVEELERATRITVIERKT